MTPAKAAIQLWVLTEVELAGDDGLTVNELGYARWDDVGDNHGAAKVYPAASNLEAAGLITRIPPRPGEYSWRLIAVSR